MMDEEVKRFMLVGHIRKALNDLCEATGRDYSLYIPNKEAKEIYEALEKQYSDFYKLPIQERLYRSGMAKREEQSDDR